MQKNIVLYLTILTLLLALPGFAQEEPQTIETGSTQPLIKIKFEEPVVILSIKLYNSYGSELELSHISTSEDNTSYQYRASNLYFGRTYSLNITYRDILNNTENYSIIIKVLACIDRDKDGYYQSNGVCTQGPFDCDDANPNKYPGNSEICGNGVDENCDGADAVCPVNLSSIVVFPRVLNLSLGCSYPVSSILSVFAYYSDNTNSMISSQAVFSSNDTNIITIADNNITAKALGTAKVNATYSYGSNIRSNYTVISVVKNASYSMLQVYSPSQLIISEGSIGCNLINVFLCTIDSECSYSCTKVEDYTLVSTNTSIATISEDGKCVVGQKEGTVQLYAAYRSYKSINFSLIVQPKGIINPAFYIVPPYAASYVGTSIPFRGIVNYGDNYQMDVTPNVTFGTNNAYVLEQSSDSPNIFTGISPGSATVWGTYTTIDERNWGQEAQVLIYEQPDAWITNPVQYPDYVQHVYTNLSKLNLTVQLSDILPEDQPCSIVYPSGVKQKLNSTNNPLIYSAPLDLSSIAEFKDISIMLNCSPAGRTYTYGFTKITSRPKITLEAPSVYESPLKTYLRVTTDQPTACEYFKYEANTYPVWIPFEKDDSNSRFGYTYTKGALLTDLVDNKVYNYIVRCTGLSGLESNASIKFTVNTSTPLKILIESPPLTPSSILCTSSREFTLKVTTNKRAECFWNEGSKADYSNSNKMQGSDYSFYSAVTVPENMNSQDYIVYCQVGDSDYAEKKFTVRLDSADPVVSVDDSSGYAGYQNISFSAEKLRVKISADDPEPSCGIAKYSYQVYDQNGISISENFTESGAPEDGYFYIEGLELKNNSVYYIYAWVTDYSGRVGFNKSDGVRINLSYNPCEDGIKNGQETDVDCGGGFCIPCEGGKNCTINRDCKTGLCNITSKKCILPGCNDGVKNGNETDVDCGGNSCDPCPDGKLCINNTDCNSKLCDNTTKRCIVNPHCTNHKKDSEYGETGVDCGGKECDPCPLGSSCILDSDCQKGLVCLNGFCSINTNTTNDTCSDETLNGDETDVDCGGSCTPCNEGKKCKVNKDCYGSLICEDDVCTSTCKDGKKDGDETDVDCGGSCAPCTEGKACEGDLDCESGNCKDRRCAPASGGSNLLLILLIVILIIGGGGLLYYYYTAQQKKSKKPLFNAPPDFKGGGIQLRNLGKGSEGSPILLSKQRSSELGPRPDIREFAGMTPEQIARIRALVREKERAKLFSKFEEYNSKKETESPIYDTSEVSQPAEAPRESKEAEENKRREEKSLDELEMRAELKKIAADRKSEKEKIKQELQKIIAKGKKEVSSKKKHAK
ncbi:MAG: MopE-related protein [Candidatus Woesearchaeota archaeon]